MLIFNVNFSPFYSLTWRGDTYIFLIPGWILSNVCLANTDRLKWLSMINKVMVIQSCIKSFQLLHSAVMDSPIFGKKCFAIHVSCKKSSQKKKNNNNNNQQRMNKIDVQKTTTTTKRME